jgi:uncharacterized protein YkwD
MKLRYKVSIALLGLLIVSVVVVAVAAAHAKPPVPVVAPETISTAALYNDVNAARQAANVAALSQNPLATQAAEQKCQDMVTNDYYAHINPKTGEHGYAYAEKLIPSGTLFNENLNEGYSPTNQGWVDSWLNSPDHKATMLDPKFTDTGLAICHRPSSPAGTITIVQEFIGVPAAAQTQTVSTTADNPFDDAPATAHQQSIAPPPTSTNAYHEPATQTYNVPSYSAPHVCSGATC